MLSGVLWEEGSFLSLFTQGLVAEISVKQNKKEKRHRFVQYKLCRTQEAF